MSARGDALSALGATYPAGHVQRPAGLPSDTRAVLRGLAARGATLAVLATDLPLLHAAERQMRSAAQAGHGDDDVAAAIEAGRDP
jgi:L-aminopeptidase/D-esterase-like protein